VPVVGTVPAIKPAAEQTKTGVIGILATPGTVRRAYLDDLERKFAPARS
jgi:glutamate racemase